MPKSHPIQSSFAAGEVTPKLYGRFDTPGYKQGLAECTNMIVDSRGPVLKRSGFEHILALEGQDARLFEFNYSRALTYLVALTHEQVAVVASSSGALGTERLDNPSFIDGLLYWTPTVLSPGTVVDNGEGSITLDPGKTAAGLAQVSQTVSVDPLTPVRVRVAADFNSPAATPIQVLVGSTGPGSSDLLAADVPEGSTFFEMDIPPTGQTEVTVSLAAIGWNVGGSPVTSTRVSAISFTEYSETQAAFYHAAPYQEEDLQQIQAVMHPDGRSMTIVHHKYPPMVLTFDPVASVWSFADIIFTDMPIEWAGENYPGVTIYFQGRQWFAGTPGNPETLWGSTSGKYLTFTIGTSADDALRFTIAEHGQIVWMTSGRDMLVGTTLNEFILTSTDRVITPTDVQVEKQSSYGGAPIQSTLMGTEGLFISSDNTKLRSQWYQWTEAGWLSRDITYTNDHITQGKIRHMIYQKEPEQIIWLTTRDGELIGCTYHKDGNSTPTYGWHRHALDGQVLDAAALQEDDRTALAIAVRKTINGLSKIHIMLSDATVQPKPHDDRGPIITVEETLDLSSVFLDDFTLFVGDGTPATQTLTGLDYLEGEWVQPVNDGAVENTKQVVNGSITLDRPGVDIEVGISYTGRIRTLPLVTQAPEGGSTTAWTKRRVNIFVRCLSSASPIINGVRPPERHASTPMDTVEPVENADFRVTDLGWDEYAIIEVAQDLPKPLNIISITGESAQESL
ncbi:MAG: hypothetical protein DRI97_16530 [Bacteroidetes bacterium]|nr:MAG: hypothetical protein DRI97_16530 [Bacteroidota bacterium]